MGSCIGRSGRAILSLGLVRILSLGLVRILDYRLTKIPCSAPRPPCD